MSVTISQIHRKQLQSIFPVGVLRRYTIATMLTIVEIPSPQRPVVGSLEWKNLQEWESDHTFKDSATRDNLHPLLFQLSPSEQPHENTAVPMMTDRATGEVVKSPEGRPLRFFSFLPRHVPWRPDGLLIETWFRLDHRLEPNDIIDRMASGAKRLKSNALQQKRLRARAEIRTYSWQTGRSHPTKCEVDRLSDLTREQILLNTCMKVDLSNNVLLKPMLGDKTKADRYIDSGLPLDHFLDNNVATPPKRLRVTIELRRRLQRLAHRQGYGNEPSNYLKLGEIDRPAWWEDRNSESKKINPSQSVLAQGNPDLTHGKGVQVTRDSARAQRGGDELDCGSHSKWIEALERGMANDGWAIKRSHMNSRRDTKNIEQSINQAAPSPQPTSNGARLDPGFNGQVGFAPPHQNGTLAAYSQQGTGSHGSHGGPQLMPVMYGGYNTNTAGTGSHGIYGGPEAMPVMYGGYTINTAAPYPIAVSAPMNWPAPFGLGSHAPYALSQQPNRKRTYSNIDDNIDPALHMSTHNTRKRT